MSAPDELDDPNKAQLEHSSYFAPAADESPPEERFEPVVVDLIERPGGKNAGGVADGGAAELRAQLHQQREATAVAQAQAREAAQRAQFAEQRVMGASVNMIDSALESAQQQSANAEAKFQAALDAADHKLAAQAQRELSDIRHNLLRLQEQRAMVEAEVRRPQQQPQPQPQPVNVEVIARDLIQNGYPRSADWLRGHPEWTSRPDLMKRVASASNHLVDNRGFVPDTDEYFAALEQELGVTQSPRRSPAGGDYSSLSRGGARAAAPTSNAPPSLRTGQPMMRSHVPLTPAQREAAELTGMSEREYAAAFEEARVGGKLIGYK